MRNLMSRAAVVAAAAGALLIRAAGVASASVAARTRSRRLAVLVAAAIVPALAFAAPAQARAQYPYTLIDPGTFGGPSSYLDVPGGPLTNQGILLGAADTATPNSAYDSCPSNFCDGYEQHAFTWRDGRLTDLGVLAGMNGSQIYELNDHGVGAGVSQN